MRALTLVLITADPGRATAALAMLAAHAATGAATHLHIDGPAAPVLREADHRAAIALAVTLGATLSVCPTGLADHGIDPALLPAGEVSGLVGLFATLDDAARLVVI